MIKVFENNDYQAGYEIANAAKGLHQIINTIDNLDEVDLKVIRDIAQEVLDRLEKIHDNMVEE